MTNTPRVDMFSQLHTLAKRLRSNLDGNDYILLYAYNGIGKTRLSMEFKDYLKNWRKGATRDTLYFNGSSGFFGDGLVRKTVSCPPHQSQFYLV